MSDYEAVVQLAASWRLDENNVEAAVGERVIACRWRHELREFHDATIPLNTVVYVHRRQVSWRFVGKRKDATSSAREGLGLIAEGSYGAWRFDTAIDVLHVYVPNRLLSETAERLGLSGNVRLHDKLSLEDPLLRELCREVSASLTDREAGRLYIDTLSHAMMARLLRAHSNVCQTQTAFRAMKGGLAPYQLKRACEAMMTAIDAKGPEPDLNSLAAIAGLSPFHFARAFKQSTGLPPHAWLTAQRMERAKVLMAQHPAMGLTSIALSVGYSSQAAFGTAFRRATGLTPSEWRRQLNG